MNTNKQGMKKKTKHKWTSTCRNFGQHKILSKRKQEQVTSKHTKFQSCLAGACVRSSEHKVMDRSFYYNENDRDISRKLTKFHSDVVGASPVGTAPTTSSFST